MVLGLAARLKKTRVVPEGRWTSIYGYRKYLTGLYHKRALLCYVVEPIAADVRGETINRFSNGGIALSWARVLNELGYELDIISWDNTEFIPTRKYDLVVFHGGKNFDKIFPVLAKKTRIIHFLTGSHWLFNNKREDTRRSDFKKRHGVAVQRDRYIADSEDDVNNTAEGIIVLGDPSMKDTYKGYEKVMTINNASFYDPHFDSVDKDYEAARKNFLFFAGSGNIHKGLDLVIDSFVGLKEHLYIMTVPDTEVLNVFEKELKLPNIHLVGEVPMRTKKFYEVVDKCAFVILPSCSEGQAGSVVECMNQGLIPIVSKETRLDAKKYGVVLEKSTIPEIKKSVTKMAALEPGLIKNLAQKTRKVAMTQHSPQQFRKNLKSSIIHILSNR